MNIRKNIDYRDMYAALEHAVASEMKQTDLYVPLARQSASAAKRVPLLPQQNIWPSAIRMLMVSKEPLNK